MSVRIIAIVESFAIAVLFAIAYRQNEQIGAIVDWARGIDRYLDCDDEPIDDDDDDEQPTERTM